MATLDSNPSYNRETPATEPIVVVYKHSVFDEKIKNTSRERLVAGRDTSVKNVLLAHTEHNRTLDSICAYLDGVGAQYRAVERSMLDPYTRADLWIAVGGDGTFLSAARHCSDTKILGINSSPRTSVGFFCAAGPQDFEPVLKTALEGNGQARIQYERLALFINGEEYGYPILNDILVADVCPAGLSRYYLGFEGAAEFQRSSGVWICTAAGSSGAVYSAGGERLEPNDPRFQYLVREPCKVDKPIDYERGFFSGDESLRLKSAMNEGCLFIDGTLGVLTFSLGDEAELRRHEYPLQSY